MTQRILYSKLRDQFQKKTWANKLELRRKLYTLQLKEGGSVQEHMKAVTELFEALAVSEEDQVIHLLASLPDSFGMLVTVLEANSEAVPNMENVTERLLHEEQKTKDKGGGDDRRNAFPTKGNPKRDLTCHFCKKPGHFKRKCRKLAQLEASKKAGKPKHTANNAAEKEQVPNPTSDDEAMVVSHALSATSGSSTREPCAIMCNNEKTFQQTE